MSKLTSTTKRILVGRAFRSDKLTHTLLPKRIALPVFASDALSSVAYAPAEIFIVLSLAGAAAYAYAPWIAVAVAVVMIVVVLSYRQNVHAYPSGGGDYEIATKNLGRRFGLVVGSALLVDYILTVAVSIAAGVANIGSAIKFVGDHNVAFSVGIIVVVAAANLRGLKEAGAAFALPVYAFIVAIFGMLITGLIRHFFGTEPMLAESAGFQVDGTHESTGILLVFLLLRAFSSGSAALTGVEAISNGVPAFKKPKSKNAATTLALMGLMSVAMMLGIVTLAMATKVHVAEAGVRDDRAAARLPREDGDRADRRRRCSPASRSRSTWCRSRRGSSWCWPATPRSAGSRCSARSWPRTATCRDSCTPAVTGWRSPTASSSWPWSRSS